MKKIVISGIVTGFILLTLGMVGLFAVIWLLPGVAQQYFDAAFDSGSGKAVLFYIHPFVISLALSWFWNRFKSVLTGAYFTRGLEFGLIYVLIATLPMMILIYSAMNISLAMVGTWFVFALAEGLIAGLIFEKMNP